MRLLNACIPLCALLALPFAASAATLPIASGYMCGDDPLPVSFPNGFVAYNELCFSLALGDNPGGGGFTSMIGQDPLLFSFDGGGLVLESYSEPTETGRVFFQYGPDMSIVPDVNGDDPYPGWFMFFRAELDIPDTYVAILFGELRSIRLEADGFPPVGVGATMDLFVEVALTEYDVTDPLATAFYNELMALTGGTGLLILESEVIVEDGWFAIGSSEFIAVPEPGLVAALFAFGAGVLGVARRRR